MFVHLNGAFTQAFCTAYLGNLPTKESKEILLFQFYAFSWHILLLELSTFLQFTLCIETLPRRQCDQKKLPNVYKSCSKKVSLEKWYILTPLQKLPMNVRDLGQLIIAKGFKNLPKVQQSGHTGLNATEMRNLFYAERWNI